MSLITANKLNKFWKNGILPIKNALTGKKLDSVEEIMANTSSEYIAGALAVKEINNNLPQFIFDSNGKITGYKSPGGADTVFPFNSGNIVYTTGEIPDGVTKAVVAVFNGTSYSPSNVSISGTVLKSKIEIKSVSTSTNDPYTVWSILRVFGLELNGSAGRITVSFSGGNGQLIQNLFMIFYLK